MAFEIATPFRSEGVMFNYLLEVNNKDLVITIDYTATLPTEGAGIYGGFTVGFLPHNYPRLDGYSPAYGLGYASMSGDPYTAGPINLSAGGINETKLGIGFDFRGQFSVNTVGTGGLSTVSPNSICLRGPASAYDFISVTDNLSTYPVPFSLYDITASPVSEFKSARIRVTDFGNRILVDLKSSKAGSFVNYVDNILTQPLPQIVYFYIGFTMPSVGKFRIQNINVNGYGYAEDMLLQFRGTDYIGLSSPTAIGYPALISPSAADIFDFQNYTNANTPSYALGLGPLITISNDAGWPYTTQDPYLRLDQTFSGYLDPVTPIPKPVREYPRIFRKIQPFSSNTYNNAAM